MTSVKKILFVIYFVLLLFGISLWLKLYSRTILLPRRESYNTTFSEKVCQNWYYSVHQRKIAGNKLTKCLLIGAISYPGYIISKTLTNNGFAVRATEDISSLGFDTGTWNNWDRMKSIGIRPTILDYSRNEVLGSIIKWLDNAGSTIVYIPSLLFNAIHKNSFFDVEYLYTIMKTFVNLLETIVSLRNKKVKFLFIIPANNHSYHPPFASNQHAAAIRMFSHMLSSYQQFHDNVKVSFVSFTIDSELCDTAVGPLDMMSCCEESSLSRLILSAIHEVGVCGRKLVCEGFASKDNSSSTSSLRKAATQQTFDVVTSTLFTVNSIYKKDNFEFMRGYVITAVQHNLGILLFHDGLSLEFQSRLKNYYNQFYFEKVTDLAGRSKNDARFYIIYRYLLEHPEVRSMVLQDLRDGIFPGDPFRVMDVIGSDVLYVGIDKSFYLSPYEYPWMNRGQYPNCYPGEIKKDTARYYLFYNAGTVGGTRDVMLTFLTRMKQVFDEIKTTADCNMGIFNVVVHKFFNDHTFSGYPFQAYFASGISIPPGLAIRHKNTEYI